MEGGNKKFRDKKVHARRRIGATQQKVLLLLLGGFALGLTRSPRQYFRIVRAVRNEWKEIDRNTLNSAIRALYKTKLVETKDNQDGTLTLVLSDEGKVRALRYNLENIKIKEPQHWDGKWRMVMFDVPEGLKHVRDALRYHFVAMGFTEFQKSVFIHPFPCANEVEYVMEFYRARRHVRFVVASSIDNEAEYKRHFGLS